MVGTVSHLDEGGLADLTLRRQEIINDVLDGFFTKTKERARPYGHQYVTLWQTIEANTAGGKRFRPLMLLGAYEALGGTDLVSAARVGVAFELLHTALIVHDDVIDRDFVRRGQPNLAATYRDRWQATGVSRVEAEHRGQSVAVIAGDLALSFAYRLIDQSGATGAVRDGLLELMDEALFASAAGELLDIDYTGAIRLPSVENILAMARLKTAVYSFEGPLQAGALLAQASDDVVTTLAEFGKEIGTAYQIRDDLLGVFGNSAETGKSNSNDLREGKGTVIVAHAAETELWEKIAPFLGRPDMTDAQAGDLRQMLDDSGARQFAENLLDEHTSRARALLSQDEIPGALRQELEPLIDAMVTRNR